MKNFLSLCSLNQVKATIIALFDELVVPIETHQALKDEADALRRTAQQVPRLQAELDNNVAENARSLFKDVKRVRCKNCETLYAYRVGDPHGRYGRGDSIWCPVCHVTLDQQALFWESFVRLVQRRTT